MPIMPWNKHRYPKNWREIREKILRRARFRCEWCGVRNHAKGVRDASGKFVECPNGVQGDTKGTLLTIVLTIAHIDHQPENNQDSNLAALCQKCHLNHDREHHIANRSKHRLWKLEQAGQQVLKFGGS